MVRYSRLRRLMPLGALALAMALGGCYAYPAYPGYGYYGGYGGGYYPRRITAAGSWRSVGVGAGMAVVAAGTMAVVGTIELIAPPGPAAG